MSEIQTKYMIFSAFFDIMYAWERVLNIERNHIRAAALAEEMEISLLILFCFLRICIMRRIQFI